MSQQPHNLSYASYPYPYTDSPYPSSGYSYQMTQQQIVPQQPSGSVIPGVPGVPGQFVEESYIENILRLNLGKVITVYQTFENNTQWNAKIFRGRLEAAGRDHIILSDPQTGRRYLLLMVNTDYITADEELNYVPPMIPPGIR
ncbi:spore coat protein GerQ [Brevibacillus sp. H7]|uniref:spore coat protein GerQ n=1 Tax=Brevibacillus sp. H7 TaxID=3349138 RepID=UPI0037F5E28F